LLLPENPDPPARVFFDQPKFWFAEALADGNLCALACSAYVYICCCSIRFFLPDVSSSAADTPSSVQMLPVQLSDW
jgi:hypothetical protein